MNEHTARATCFTRRSGATIDRTSRLNRVTSLIRLVGFVALACVLGPAVAVAGGESETGPIVTVSAIKASPGRYAGQVVRARGRVTQAAKVPFVDVAVYLLRHDEGSMMVLGTAAPEIDSDRTVPVHVVGVSTTGSADAAENLTSAVSRFLVAHEIASESNAQRVSQVVVRFMTAFGEWIEGSAFLIEVPTSP